MDNKKEIKKKYREMNKKYKCEKWKKKTPDKKKLERHLKTDKHFKNTADIDALLFDCFY